MERVEFEKLVQAGIELIPKNFLAKLKNVAILVDDEPTREQLEKVKIGKGISLFGLYEGVPLTKRGPHYGMVLPDKITIFQGPIERLAGSEREITEIIKNTVWHEIAHHFGSDEKGAKKSERKQQI